MMMLRRQLSTLLNWVKQLVTRIPVLLVATLSRRESLHVERLQVRLHDTVPT